MPSSIPEEILSGKPHRLTMGLRSLNLSDWLDADPGHPQLAERQHLLRERRAAVYQQVPGFREHTLAVAQAVAEHTGQELLGRDAPLVEAATMVRDDLCVLAHADDAWRLVAAVVCFPSRWRLADKMGLDVLAIHDPVPGYRAALGRPTQRVFEGLVPRWRVNWTLVEDPSLFQPQPASTAPSPPGPNWYLRVERQCLVPVAEAVAFTIRTDVVALAALPTDQRDAILGSVSSAPRDLAVYRGWVSR